MNVTAYAHNKLPSAMGHMLCSHNDICPWLISGVISHGVNSNDPFTVTALQKQRVLITRGFPQGDNRCKRDFYAQVRTEEYAAKAARGPRGE